MLRENIQAETVTAMKAKDKDRTAALRLAEEVAHQLTGALQVPGLQHPQRRHHFHKWHFTCGNAAKFVPDVGVDALCFHDGLQVPDTGEIEIFKDLDHGVLQRAKIRAGSWKALNSSALPDGSLMNSVACSPA